MQRSDLALRFALAHSIARARSAPKVRWYATDRLDRDYAMALVALRPGISDREMAESVYGPGTPGHIVTSICRALADEKAITRRVRADGLFGNFLSDD